MSFKKKRINLDCVNGTHLSRALLVTLSVYLFSALGAHAFLVARSNNVRLRRQLSTSPISQTLEDPANMRLREIQSELKQRSVSYDDCFDRDSLTNRLLEARKNNPIQTLDDAPTGAGAKESPIDEKESPQSPTTPQVNASDEFDRQATLTELRTQRIKFLREQLSQYNVRWGNMIEKEELVQALCNAMEERFLISQNFSRSGELVAGEVFDSNEDVLMKELNWSNSDLNQGKITSAHDSSNPTSHAPLLLDVYATWCGPCQFMVPHLKEAAKEFGPGVRVMKLDSDKFPRIASALKVGGLPSVILFDGGDVCKEVDRIEGALMKDQLVGFVKKHFST